jgi:GDPmannose 4,6-dehydratase
MGNIDALRDWGHARDYVRMQWMMLQQDQPEDFVIATGQQISVRAFIERSAVRLGISLRWEGLGVGEIGIVDRVSGFAGEALKTGDVIVRIDPRYFRPAEVQTLLGDPTKAKMKMGWTPEISIDELIAEMVESDLAQARQHALLKSHGYDVSVGSEG